MLVMPRAMWLTGLGAGMAMSAVAVGAGGWTMYVLFALYLEFKARRAQGGGSVAGGAGGAGGGEGPTGGSALKAGQAPGAAPDAPAPATPAPTPPTPGPGRRGVVQYHDVVATLGSPAAASVVQVLTVLALLGSAVAQILACATNTFVAVGGGGGGGSAAASLSKRAYALAWGGAMLAFTAVPAYTDTRAINAIALVGTTFTAWYVTTAARPAGAAAAAAAGLARLPPTPLGPASARNFFLGGSVMVGALSGHVICIEIFDALGGSPRFLGAYLLAQVWVLTLTVVPAGVAAAALGPTLARADSVFGALPASPARAAAAWLMNVHQVVVFGLVLMPLYFYVERGAGMHGGPRAAGSALGRLVGWRRLAARVGVRLPISLLVWVLALAFPFYGAINALVTALSFPTLSFLVPCLLFNWVYGRPGGAGEAARAGAPLPPPTLGGRVPLRAAWAAALAFNWLLAVVALAFMCGALYFSVGAVVTGVRADGVFARCWQCAPAAAAVGAKAG